MLCLTQLHPHSSSSNKHRERNSHGTVIRNCLEYFAWGL